MADGDGWTSRLVRAIAEDLEAAGIGVLREDGVYAPGEVPILNRDILPNPDRIITLAAYSVATPPGLADMVQGVQVRLRGTTNPDVVDDLADAIYERFHGREQYTLGTIQIVQSYRQSYAPLGKDDVGRWERSDNYYVEAMRPTTHNTD